MLGKDMFEKFDTSYEAVSRMIHSIALRAAGRYPQRDVFEELVSEGWMIVIEALPGFSPQRGVKLTTYLWMAVNGGLIRLLNKRIRREKFLRPNDDDTPSMTTDSVPHSGVFDNNPYHMPPDLVYEKRERAEMWGRVSSEFGDDVRDMLEKTPRNADTAVRRSVSRDRKRRLLRLQASVRMMMS